MQPRYGFTLKRKPTSGLSLVARMPFVASSQTCTAARGWSCSRYSSAVEENGFGGLDQARGFTPAMLDVNGCSGQAGARVAVLPLRRMVHFRPPMRGEWATKKPF